MADLGGVRGVQLNPPFLAVRSIFYIPYIRGNVHGVFIFALFRESLSISENKHRENVRIYGITIIRELMHINLEPPFSKSWFRHWNICIE